MKKIYLILAILAAVISSCSKENPSTIDDATLGSTLTAYISGGTKTAFGEKEGNQTKMVWSLGDELLVVGESDFLTSHKYTLRDTCAGKCTGVFFSQDPTSETGNIAAFYPYSWSQSNKAGGYNQITIPSSQNSETIGSGIMPMFGKGTKETGLTFEHVCSIIRVKLYTSQAGKTLTSAKIVNGNNIVGRLYSPSCAAKIVGFAPGASQMIEYACNQSVSTDSSNPTEINFLIGCSGGTKLSNFQLQLFCSDGSSFCKTMSGSKSISAGSVVVFNALECEFSTTSKVKISYDGGTNWSYYLGIVTIPDACTDIAFESSEASLSESDITMIVNSIETLPTGREINLDFSRISCSSTTITKGIFKDTKKVADLNLPNNIITLEDYCFQSSRVKKITIPATCNDIRDCPIRYTTRAYFDVASGNSSYKSIDGSLYSFDEKKLVCADYSKSVITLVDGVETIGKGAFLSNNQITSICLPSTLTMIESEFAGLSNLGYIDASALSVPPTFSNFYYDMSNLGVYPGYGVSNAKICKVATGKVDEFSLASGWSYLLTPTPTSGKYTSWVPWTITDEGAY